MRSQFERKIPESVYPPPCWLFQCITRNFRVIEGAEYQIFREISAVIAKQLPTDLWITPVSHLWITPVSQGLNFKIQTG